MKIAMVGCGALGSFYGAKLCRAGQEVHFLLRGDYERVRRHGVHIRSVEGDFHVNPKCAQSPDKIGLCDLVIIGLKTTANHVFPQLLPPLVGPQTAILTLQNGLGNEAEVNALFPLPQILGGLCFVCLNRIAPGEIQHLAHGRVVMGEYQRWPEPRTHDIASMFRHAGVPCDVTENLEQAHWEKLVWNIPFNGLGVAATVGYDCVERGRVDSEAPVGPCLTTDLLLADPRWHKCVRELMQEVIGSAQALGLAVENTAADRQIARTLDMGSYKASTLIDYERKQPLELKALFAEPLRQALAAGMQAPRLEALTAVLQQLDPGK